MIIHLYLKITRKDSDLLQNGCVLLTFFNKSVAFLLINEEDMR